MLVAACSTDSLEQRNYDLGFYETCLATLVWLLQDDLCASEPPLRELRLSWCALKPAVLLQRQLQLHPSAPGSFWGRGSRLQHATCI